MPLTDNTIELVNESFLVHPEFGFGWALIEGVKSAKPLPVPGAFEAKLADVLFESSDARALLGRIELEIASQKFSWGCFVPRTTSLIDLRRQSVGCNVLLSLTKPFLCERVKYPDPEHVRTGSETHVRGFARISLSTLRSYRS